MDKRKLRRLISVDDFCRLKQLGYELRCSLTYRSSMPSAWLQADHSQRIELAVTPGVLTRKELLDFALFCLSQRHNYMTDKPARELFAVQRKYVAGKATPAQLNRAAGASLRFIREQVKYRTPLLCLRARHIAEALDRMSSVLEEDCWDVHQLNRIRRIAGYADTDVVSVGAWNTHTNKNLEVCAAQHVWLRENTKPNFGYFQHYMLEQERQLQLLSHSVTELNWQAQRVINVLECLQRETV